MLTVKVAGGDPIKAVDVAAVMESMKMELRIASEIDGVIATVHCHAGETVDRNSIVATVTRSVAKRVLRDSLKVRPGKPSCQCRDRVREPARR